jgi:hypothetical protein
VSAPSHAFQLPLGLFFAASQVFSLFALVHADQLPVAILYAACLVSAELVAQQLKPPAVVGQWDQENFRAEVPPLGSHDFSAPFAVLLRVLLDRRGSFESASDPDSSVGVCTPFSTGSTAALFFTVFFRGFEAVLVGVRCMLFGIPFVNLLAAELWFRPTLCAPSKSSNNPASSTESALIPSGAAEMSERSLLGVYLLGVASSYFELRRRRFADRFFSDIEDTVL